MEKDFDEWNKSKKFRNVRGTYPHYREREIWSCALGVNIGFEQDGTGKNFDRPIVVIRAFNRNTFFGVALTGKMKKGEYYLPLGMVGKREACANLSQVRLIDAKRLIRRIDILDIETFECLRKRLKQILFA
ncbi:MAG: PemK-like protein [Parcubacteria bacterium C7867-004]|nr:MAG: PemK-like protein [Parcubacteria bacterium C7867-004]